MQTSSATPSWTMKRGFTTMPSFVSPPMVDRRQRPGTLAGDVHRHIARTGDTPDAKRGVVERLGDEGRRPALAAILAGAYGSV